MYLFLTICLLPVLVSEYCHALPERMANKIEEKIRKSLVIIEVSADRKRSRIYRNQLGENGFKMVSRLSNQDAIHGAKDSLYFVEKLQPYTTTVFRVSDKKIKIELDEQLIDISMEEFADLCKKMGLSIRSVGRIGPAS